MARTRNIKPSFFTNDELAELCPYARLFFIGLWTQADKEGRVEDRPKKLKAAIFPYEEIDCNELAAKLHGKKFIRRYAVDGVRYIEITNFKKHQNPHPKEQASIIPEPAENCEAVELHDLPCKDHDLPSLISFPSLSNPSLKEKETTNVVSKNKAQSLKSFFGSEDFDIPQDWGDMAYDDGLTADEINWHFTKFKNYWLASSGAKAAKKDWKRTWQNWYMQELERKKRKEELNGLYTKK